MLPEAITEGVKKGMQSVSPPVSGYFTWDPNSETRMSVGPMVTGMSAEAEGDEFGVRAVGGCRCATAVHVGSDVDQDDTYKATFEWIEAKGYKPSNKPVFEVFLNDPKDVEESQLRTQIFIPVVAKSVSKPTT